MIRKLLWKKVSRLQLAGAILGTLAGLVLLLASLQFYLDMQQIFDKNRDLLDPEYMVINKKVSMLETFNLRQATFSTKEIEEIRSQPWADRVEGFISNDFAVSAYTESDRFPDFYTDLFFESIPDDFLDVKDEDWQWRKGNRTLPVILPQDYLNLYNFGFAPSQGLPQISPGTVNLVNFTITIRGKGSSEEFRGRIIGFSNRVNSILVPYSFLTWANREFGYRDESKISRVVIVTPDPTDPAIVKFLNENGYETILEKLKSSRMNIILKFILSFLGGLGIVIISLAFLVFVVSFQLLISRSEEKIRKLKNIGYGSHEVARPYILSLGMIMVFILGAGTFLVYVLKNQFIGMAEEWAMDLPEELNSRVLILSVGISLLLFLVNSVSIWIQTRKI